MIACVVSPCVGVCVLTVVVRVQRVWDIIHPARKNLTSIRGYARLGGLPDNPRTDPQDRAWVGPHDRLFTEEESEELDFDNGPDYGMSPFLFLACFLSFCPSFYLSIFLIPFLLPHSSLSLPSAPSSAPSSSSSLPMSNVQLPTPHVQHPTSHLSLLTLFIYA